jgi:hypothetical protein
MALEDLEFGKRALAVKYLKRETVGSFLTICILLEERFQTSTSINQVPAMKPCSSKILFWVFIFMILLVL